MFSEAHKISIIEAQIVKPTAIAFFDRKRLPDQIFAISAHKVTFYDMPKLANEWKMSKFAPLVGHTSSKDEEKIMI